MEAQSKTYDSRVAGRYMLALAASMGKALNATKLQKLLYITYGYFIAKKNHRIVDEEPRAWPFGPVFPKVQKKVDTSLIVRLDDNSLDEISKDEELTNVMKDVIKKYSGFSASQLSNWSHQDGGPWEQTKSRPGFKWNDPIPDPYILEYFSGLNVR